MKGSETKSLSSKIILSISLISLFVGIVIFTVFENINRKAFYDVEIEKAKIIASTIEPLIALNIFLDMQNKIDQLSQQLIINPNILSVKVLKNNETISVIKSKKYKKNFTDVFVVKKDIFQPNSKMKIGSLILTYSNENYKKLTQKYEKYTTILVIVLLIIFIILSLYIKSLLFPLRKIANSLSDYSPNKEIDIPVVEQNNEIGLISYALHGMQEKILLYSKRQKDINKYLEEKVNEKTLELTNQLYTNALTGLPNRLNLLRIINLSPDGALLIINIDDFKEINDFFGQVSGDSILVEFSSRLKKMFDKKGNIILNHLSGDEFALLFTEKPTLEEFIQIAQELVYDIEKMIFYYQNSEIAIRVSIGGTYQLDAALEKADIALKSAKRNRKSFILYDEKLNVEKEYKENIDWVAKLKKAIKEDKIVPYFQPIFDNNSGKLVSCESLIRLIDDEGNVISPFKFLTIAKKIRLYGELTKIMVRKSCEYFENIDCDFSINLSVDDMLDSDVVSYIKYAIDKYGVSKKVIFEILESEGIENYEEIASFVNEMKELGCRVAIDDFGSGYSSFEYLLKLNIDYIKIDGTLIKNLDTDYNAQIVVETIVDFTKKLEMITIAEFVHNEEVFAKVKELNVNRTQGFYLAQPQKEIDKYL